MGTRLAPYPSCRDAPGALRWLQALGFEVARLLDPEGGEWSLGSYAPGRPARDR